jgi:hypothetical protein
VKTQHNNWLVAICAFLSCAAAPAGSDSDQASFQLRLPITPVGAAPVQRVRLPLEVPGRFPSNVHHSPSLLRSSGILVH